MLAKNPSPLQTEAIPLAFWTETVDPSSGLKVSGYGANTIFRFERPILLRRLELEAFRLGEDVLKTGPVVIEAFHGPEPVGTPVFEGIPDWKDNTAAVDFAEGIPAWAIGIRCDEKEAARHHNIMMWDPATWNVPFRMFEQTRFFGSLTAMPELVVPVEPPLTRGVIAPESSNTVRVGEDGLFVHFESRFLKASFSLRRPFLSHLSWDALGERPLEKNFLAEYLPCHSSGPWTLDLVDATPPFHWGGRVDVEGRRVIYSGLKSREGLTVDAAFEIHEKGIVMRLEQHCEKPMTLLEASAWRFVWDGQAAGSVSTLAIPDRGAHRNGYTQPRGSWHLPGAGSLAFEVRSSTSPVMMQTEQSGFHGKAPTWNYAGFGRRYVFSQIQIGTRPEPFGTVTLPPGTASAELLLTVTNLEPRTADRQTAHPGIRRAWGSGFFFRPEQSGLANNSFSVLAANVLHGPADMVPYSADNAPIPHAAELLRYTLGVALKMGGPHYGAQYAFHHDTAPSLLISAGRLHQTAPDAGWLHGIWPYLKSPLRYLLDNLDESGMYVCRHHSGNSGGRSGGSNAWDDIRFGHHDGYSATLAYRALHSAAALAREAGDPVLGGRCREAAAALKSAFAASLYNPATGWLAGWRSRDGQLHDHGFLFVNGMAISFGLIEGEQAKEVLRRLEAARIAAGHTDFRHGLMVQLWPVPSCDLASSAQNSLFGRGWRIGLRPDGLDTFGVFCNGCLTPFLAGFYVRALSMHGFTETADRICDQLLESYERGLFDGDRNGAEYFTHEGIPCGYEGSLIHSYPTLAEIAKHKGWIKPVQPEWWPG